MKVLTGLTSDPAQNANIPLPDGTLANLTLYYRQNQLGWFYDMSYQDFTLNGQRLVTSPNMLYQFQNQIPFGLAMLVEGNGEPLSQEVFVDGTGTLVLLDQSDILNQAYTVYRGF